MPKKANLEIPPNNAARVYFQSKAEYIAVRDVAARGGMSISKFIRECVMSRLLPTPGNESKNISPIDLENIGYAMPPEVEQQIRDKELLENRSLEDIFKEIENE